MEDPISSILESGEHLIWQSRPEEFETLDKTYKKVFVNRVIAAIIAAAIIVGSYILIITQKAVEINIYFILAVIVLSALAPLSVFNYASKLRKRAVYAATNKRLIVYAGDLRTANYDMIKTACFNVDSDGHTSFLCGPDAVNAKPSAWRVYSLFGLNDLEAEGGPVCERFAFYALQDPEELREVLSPYIKID